MLYRRVVLVITLLFVPGIVLISALNPAAPTATAAPSTYLNFQARLLNSSGNLVPDGSYSIEFKLYKSLAAGGSAQGVCVGGGTDDCEWVETRTGGNVVNVVNGYFSVNLASVTAFGSTIDWSAQHWLTMRIGGIGGPSWDPEMSPRIQMTAIPLAFVANNVNSGNTSVASTASANTLLQSGNTTGTTSNSGTVTLQSGNVTSGNSGNITIDAGTASGTKGTISIAAANASSLILGRTGLTTLNNGAFTVAEALAANGSGTGLAVANNATVGGTLDVNGFAALGSTASVTATDVLKVSETFTNTSGSRVGINTSIIANPASASSGSTWGSSYQVFTQGANAQNMTGTLFGTVGGVDTGGTGTVTTAKGVAGQVLNSGNGTVTNAYGAASYVDNAGTSGVITNGYTAYNTLYNSNATTMAIGTGTRNFVQNYSTGTITLAQGTENYISNRVAGTITAAYGDRILIENLSTGTISDAFGLQVQATLNPSGTVTRGAGIDIAEQSAATNNTNLLIGTTTIPAGQFSIYNSSTDVNVFAGSLRVGSTTAPTVALDVTGAALISSTLGVTGAITGATSTNTINGLVINSGALTSVTGITTNGGYTQSGATANTFTGTLQGASNANLVLTSQGTGDVVLNTDADTNIQITATAVPGVDQVAITNAGQAVTTAGVNNLSLNYVGGAAAVEASAQRIDLQPGSTTGGTWSGIRLVQNATGPATGVTSAGIKLEGPTTGGAGTYNALNVANIGAVTTGGINRGLNITGTNSQAAGTIRGIQLNNLTAGAASEIGIDLGTGWDNLLTYNNGATVLINGTGQWNLGQVSGTLGVGSGGTGLGSTPTNGQLLIGNGTNYTLAVITGTGITVTNGAGTIALSTIYGSASNTAAQGNVTFTCPSGTGNLSGTGNSITIGTGGTCTSLTVVNNPTFSGLITGQAGLTLTNGGALTTQRGADYSTTGTTNDWNFGTSSLVRLTGASTQTITGLANGADGRILTIVNAAAQAAVITNDDASSTTAADRIFTGTGASLSVAAGSSINLAYDSGASRWRVVGGVAGGSGVTATGAITGTNANGLNISGNTINLTVADATNGGALTSGTQTIGGAKTFNTLIVAPTSTNTINGLIINAGALSGIAGYTQASGAFAFSGAGNFSVDSAAFDVTTAGAISGVTTLGLSGAITGATATNTINGLIINSGALTGVTGITTNGGYTQSGSTANTLTGATSINNTLTVTGTSADVVYGATATVNATSASTTNSQVGLAVYNTASPGSASARHYIGIEASASSGSSNMASASLSGLQGEVSFSGTGNIAVLAGVRGAITKTSSGTATSASALYAMAATNSAGVITSNYGLFVENQTVGSTDYGVYVAGADTYALFVDAGATRLDGTLEVQSTATIGLTGTTTGQIGFKGATAASGTINLVGQANPTGTRTITLPDETGTVCTNAATGACTATGGFVQLQSTTPGTQQTGNLNISGTGIFGGALTATGNLTVDTNTLFVNAAANIVGIGTTTLTDGILNIDGAVPNVANGAALRIDSTLSSTTNNQNGLYIRPTASPGSASVRTYAALNFASQSSSANISGASLMGIYGGGSFSGTGTLGSAYGAYFQNYNNTTGTITTSYGTYIDNPSNAGTVGTNYGLFVASQTAGGSDYGVYIQNADTYALWVDSGATRLDGTLDVAGTTTLSGILSVAPSTITDTITLGAAAQTGTITIGQSTATNLISIGSGNVAANATQTITIGGGTTGGTTGGLILNLGTGIPATNAPKAINIGSDGTTTGAANIILGSVGAAAHTTLIQGGNNSQAIRLQAASGGTITIGSQTGSTANTIILGASGSTTNADNISLNNTSGTNAGTITIGGSGTATGTITVGQSTGTNLISIGSGNVAASATQTITIGGGTTGGTAGGLVLNLGTGIPAASAPKTINIGNSGTTTGTVAVDIGSSGAAAHTTVISGGNSTTGGAEAVRLQSNATNGSIGLKSGTTTGAINLNVSNNSATNINTGTSTGAFSVGNSAAGAMTLQSASTIALTGSTTVTGLTSGSAYSLYVTSSIGGNGGVAIEQTNTSGTALTGLNIVRTGAGGTTTSMLGINNSGGTITNGILFTGTIGTDINTAAGRGITISANANSTFSTTSGQLAIRGADTTTVSTTQNTGSTFGVNLFSGNSTTSGNTGLVYIASGDATSGTAGNVTIDVGNSSTGISVLGLGNNNTGNTTKQVIIGSTNQTGTIIMGQSTASNTVTIGNNNTATGNTQTINIGAGTPAGTGKAVITIGNPVAASSVTLQSGTGGTSLTSTGNITIGTSDTTGTLLILDTKTGSGDPTAVDGAMYYNSNYGIFRCAQNGVWTDCSNPSSMTMGIDLREDFFSQNAQNNSQIGTYGWLNDNTGCTFSNVSATNTDSADRPGIMTLGTGTTTTGCSGFQMGFSNSWIIGGNTTFETAIRVPVLSTATDEFDVRVGLSDVDQGQGTDGIYFEYDRNTSTSWTLVTTGTGTRTKFQSTTGACGAGGTATTIAANTYYSLKFVVNAATSQVDAYINNVFMGCSTTNIPTTSELTNPNIHILKSAGTNNRDFDIDYYSLVRPLTTKR